MSRMTDSPRRLVLGRALTAAVFALPRLWSGAWGALFLWATTTIISGLIGPGPMSMGTSALAFISGIMALGALVRLAISGDLASARRLGLGVAGLQLGKPERRLTGAALLCLLFLAMIVSLLGLAVLAIFGAAEIDVDAIKARDWPAVGPAWKLAVLSLVGAGAVFVPVLLSVRLSLFAPATVARQHMVSLAAMQISKGAGWALAGGLAVTAAPGIGFAFLQETVPLPARLMIGIASIVMVGWQAPLTVAFLGVAYRHLEDGTAGEAA